MPKFTIETAYRLPVYRQRTYEAPTLDEACRLAIEDDDWNNERHDFESAGRTYVSGAWQGADGAYRGVALHVPAQFIEPILAGEPAYDEAPSSDYAPVTPASFVVARVINRFEEMDYLYAWDRDLGTTMSLSLARALRFATEVEAQAACDRARHLDPNFVDGRPIRYRVIRIAC
jgi:hypothetical protein